jgi:hypothetical protein
VGEITAIINAPPKHVDVLDGKTYDINSQDENTKAVLTREQGTSTNMTISTRREFSLATSFTATLGDPEATHTRDSIEMSYGAHFENSEGAFDTVNFSQTTTATNDDALVYMRTEYDVWEYPVYAINSTVPASYLTVIFPKDLPTLVVDTGDDCDSWYRPRHQLDNMWTYPASQTSFNDLAQEISTRNSYRLSDGMGNDFTYSDESGDMMSYTTAVEMGISNDFEWQIGGEQVSVSLFDIVEFSTRMPSFMWSMKTAYNQGELSTLDITTHQTTEYKAIWQNRRPGGMSYDHFSAYLLVGQWLYGAGLHTRHRPERSGMNITCQSGFIYRNC